MRIRNKFGQSWNQLKHLDPYLKIMGAYIFKFFIQGNNEGEKYFKRLEGSRFSKKRQHWIMHPPPAVRWGEGPSALQTNA